MSARTKERRGLGFSGGWEISGGWKGLGGWEPGGFLKGRYCRWAKNQREAQFQKSRTETTKNDQTALDQTTNRPGRRLVGRLETLIASSS
jgi:hypothetical protein